MRIRALMSGLGLTVLLMTGCGSDEPSVEERACEAIKATTPGALETLWNVETLADPDASYGLRKEAMEEQLAIQSGSLTFQPYRCEGATWKRFLAEFQRDFKPE